MAKSPRVTAAPAALPRKKEDNTLAWLALEVENAVAQYTLWRQQHPKARVDPALCAGIKQRLITDLLNRLKARLAALEEHLGHPVGRYLVPQAVVGELAVRFRQQDTAV